MDLTLARIEARLTDYRPAVIRNLGFRRSAVAVVLRFRSAAPEVLLMKRAERPGDLWSGHVSLPGGREQPGDGDLMMTAMRETHEEVGLALDRTARPLGSLDTIHAIARGRQQTLTITPYVFAQTEPAELALGDEAAHAFWLPLDLAASGAISGEHEYRHGPLPVTLPCWRYQGNLIWGLTYQMLGRFLEVVTAPGS